MRSHAIRSLAACVSVFLGLAPTVHAQSCSDEVLLLELDAGTGGAVLRTPEGAPVVGGSFALRVDGALPLETGVIFYSAPSTPVFEPLFGATIHTGLPVFFKLFGTNLGGSSKKLFNAKNVGADLCGVEVTFQAGVTDPGAPGGLAITNAVRIRVGSVSEPPFGPVVEDAPEGFEDLRFADVDGDGLRDRLGASGSTWLALALPGGGFGPDAELTFPAPVNRAPIVGDYNLDGDRDLAAPGSSSVAVLLLDGSQQAVSSTQYGVGAAREIAQADLDGDGDLDLVVARDDPEVALLVGLGNGAFSGPFAVAVGAPQVAVATGDLNQDGVADFVCSAAGTVVALGDGLGGFSVAPPLGSAGLDSLELADLDDDGLLDVGGVDGSVLRLHLGNGDGTLGPAVDTALASAPDEHVFVDLDGDGLVDSVAARAFEPLVVRLGSGGGSFAAPVEYQPSFSALAATDVDLDGSPDVVLATGAVAWTSTAFGEGDGTLRAGREIPGSDGTLLGTADLDGNGFDDLVLRVGADEVTTLLGSADGFGSPVTSVIPGTWTEEVHLADFTGDGAPDLFYLFQFVVFPGDGQGGFGSGIASSVTPSWTAATTGDFNEDGAMDVIALSPGGFAGESAGFYAGNGDGTFASPPSMMGGSGSPFERGIETGDVNGDGHADLVWHWTASFHPFPSESNVRILLGAGDGTFASGGGLVTDDDINNLTVADVDGDGYDDVITGEFDGCSGLYAVRRSTATGQLLAPWTSTPVFLLVNGAAVPVGDFDQDGFLDLLLDRTPKPGRTSLYSGNGDGTFSLSSSTRPVQNGFAVIDADGDGILDLVANEDGRMWLIENLVGDG